MVRSIALDGRTGTVRSSDSSGTGAVTSRESPLLPDPHDVTAAPGAADVSPDGQQFLMIKRGEEQAAPQQINCHPWVAQRAEEPNAVSEARR